MAGWSNFNGDDLPPSLHEHYTRFLEHYPSRPIQYRIQYSAEDFHI